jgi:hypothetical protein
MKVRMLAEGASVGRDESGRIERPVVAHSNLAETGKNDTKAHVAPLRTTF